MSDAMARLAALRATTAQQAAAKPVEKKEAAIKPAKQAVEESFVVSEAEIKANPVYKSVTDPKLGYKEISEKLVALKKYNPDLTPEENLANRELSTQFLLYIENQLHASSQRGLEFTNDDAFSLYDATVRGLYGHIGDFKGYMEPFVKALGILQAARDAGMSSKELIEDVQILQKEISDLEQQAAEKEAALVKAREDLLPIEAEVLKTTQSLTGLNEKIRLAQEEKAATEGLKKAEEEKNFFTRNRTLIRAYDDTLSYKTSDIDGYNNQITALANVSGITAGRLDAQQKVVDEIAESLRVISESATAKKDAFTKNEDAMAIATLIEITGENFKAKRDTIVSSAQNISTVGIAGIEKSISRFKSGERETEQQLNTTTNLNEMVAIISAADSQARIEDAKFMAEQAAILERIKAAKGDEAMNDPVYEKAKKQAGYAAAHSEATLVTSERATGIGQKALRQIGVFKGLNSGYAQKANEATQLRTSAAVEVPSQLVITVKAVEMAVAGEATNLMSDALADLSKSTRGVMTSVFDTVSKGRGAQNDRLKSALEQTMGVVDLMESVERDLRSKVEQGVQIRKDTEIAEQALREITEGVARVVVDTERKAIVGGAPVLEPTI